MKNLDLKDLEILVTTQDFQKQVEGYGLTTAISCTGALTIPGCCKATSGRTTTSTHISLNCSAFWSFGRNLSKVPCIRSLLRIPASLNRSRSKQWVAFSGFIDQRLD